MKKLILAFLAALSLVIAGCALGYRSNSDYEADSFEQQHSDWVKEQNESFARMQKRQQDEMDRMQREQVERREQEKRDHKNEMRQLREDAFKLRKEALDSLPKK